jgi:NAD(P)-dependent dehydrogenase (short-subunit alcohol dehydrogenase family)
MGVFTASGSCLEWRGVGSCAGASLGGLAVSPDLGLYHTSKAALIHLTRQLALELAPKVRVNAVAPGVVRTRLAEALWKDDEDRVAGVTPDFLRGGLRGVHEGDAATAPHPARGHRRRRGISRLGRLRLDHRRGHERLGRTGDVLIPTGRLK